MSSHQPAASSLAKTFWFTFEGISCTRRMLGHCHGEFWRWRQRLSIATLSHAAHCKSANSTILSRNPTLTFTEASPRQTEWHSDTTTQTQFVTDVYHVATPCFVRHKVLSPKPRAPSSHPYDICTPGVMWGTEVVLQSRPGAS